MHDIFVCGAEYDMKERYTWEELAEEPLILLESNSTSRRYLNDKFGEKGIKLKPQIEFAVHDLLLRFASINFGISCVVEEFSEESLEKGIVRRVPAEPPLPARSVGCAYLKHNPLSLAAQEFLELIHEEENVK